MTHLLKMPTKQHDLLITGEIGRWDEALPLGNGLTGCLMWGNGHPLKLSLDRGDLWDNRLAPEALAEDYTYANLIELVKRKDMDAIRKRYQFNRFTVTPTKIPAGRIELTWGRKADRMDFRLNLSTAIGESKLQFGDSECLVRAILHAKDGIGYVRVSGNAELPFVSIVPPSYSAPDGEENVAWDSLALLQYPDPKVLEEDGWIIYRQKTCELLEFAIVVGSKMVNSDQLELAYKIVTNKDGADWLIQAKQDISRALRTGWEAIVESHSKWWESFWAKSSITLPDQETENQWYLTNYFLGSCSRKGSPPMPLQGVWTADEGRLPPWKGDYHNDLNTQLSYWHYLKANHLEEGESFLDFLWELRPAAKQFAESFFDAPGICLPSVMSMEGKSIGGWAMYCTNLINQVWLCQAFDHYWKYTGDHIFLEQRAYVYFSETAACLLRWLTPGTDGKLRLPLSSSPEIHDDTLEAWLTPNSNNDLALLHYFFETLHTMALLLDKEGEAERWCRIRGQLPDLAVNENNVLMLSPDESLKESHRHLSHAMAIYPLNLLSYHRSEREKLIIDSTIRNLEELGKGLWVGFSFAWMANLYARQGNGEAALYQLKLLWENLCSVNGFHLNGDYRKRGITAWHYRPFTLESNMAAADALQEMLLQNYDGVIRVFPAVPAEWKRENIKFERLRGGLGSLVSAEWGKGKLQFIRLEAEKDAVVRVQNVFGTEWLILEKENKQMPITVSADGTYQIQLLKGESVTILPEAAQGE
ncbi:hypothetical protein A8709_13845 [Paenibacillus pectinilyticus]|uniref:Glycosyl hydrolase family 95 catalytic domain-containing protein n=1 Tax=Paenibacillus pectinilyticus TaxID=512399 RepID=A0A1C1A3P7_9BACL|nr:hypothetical protein [Paenibacillus pectinilyticus]OCT15181.1 hypothetical protein A8709_13845 [Paenibacillus pectinilyticus]